MNDLPRGGNAPVPGDRLLVTFDWTLPARPVVEADASAYLLTTSGQVRGDADMLFYNQPSGAGGAVRYDPGAGPRGGFVIDLARVPDAVERIALCVTVHEAGPRGQTLALLAAARITVAAEGAAPALRFVPDLSQATEAAMTFGELYRRQGTWKFRAVGQGFEGGLAPLAGSFGIDVAEEAPIPAPPPPPPAPPPVRLSKVSLEKPGQAVSLEKRGADFGEIVVNLNWSRPRGGVFRTATAVDLDLGCLFELADGRCHVVQALGRQFGAYDAPPYIALSGDDRTGDVATGETMRINGAHWNAIRRILLFANIYDGAPNWRATDGVVTFAMPDQPPIEVRMTEGNDRLRLCGVVMIENEDGRLKATRIVEYFRDQQALDQRFGFGLRWTAGRKD